MTHLQGTILDFKQHHFKIFFFFTTVWELSVTFSDSAALVLPDGCSNFLLLAAVGQNVGTKPTEQ